MGSSLQKAFFINILKILAFFATHFYFAYDELIKNQKVQ